MKKLLTLASVAAFAVSAQAVQLNWGTSGALFNSTQQMTTANGYATTAYLVYLGTVAGSASWASFDVQDFVASPSATATKAAAAPGTVVATSGDNEIFTWGSAINNGGGANYTDGQSVFGVLFVSADSTPAGNPAGWDTGDLYYFQSSTFTLQTSGANWNAGTTTYTFTQAVPSGSTWTPVPEPATGMLALAGVAMLIRRRRRA